MSRVIRNPTRFFFFTRDIPAEYISADLLQNTGQKQLKIRHEIG